ncbi:MAG: hypothetical protein WCQ99_02940 [Pseudomonadota bacterium]
MQTPLLCFVLTVLTELSGGKSLTTDPAGFFFKNTPPPPPYASIATKQQDRPDT